jgi:ribose-phosphate pyrophosphokinase
MMNTITSDPTYFALSESQQLAAAVGQHAGLPLAGLEDRRFEGDEFKLRPLETVRGRTAFVLQSLAGTQDAPATERLVRLLFLLNGLRDAGAAQRVALIPYLVFARKDQRTQVRDPVYTRYVAQLLEASGADRLITLDVHNPAALDNSFRIPVDHLTALPMMVDHFATHFAHMNLAIASPDIGGIKRAQIFRELLEKRLGRDVELAFIEKRRSSGAISGRAALAGNIAGQAVILLDDMCATGETLLRAADVCNRAGAASIHVAVTHAPLAAGVGALVTAANISSILITDSAGISSHLQATSGAAANKLVTLSIAPLFGRVLQRILANRPLAPLLSRWPVAFEEP